MECYFYIHKKKKSSLSLSLWETQYKLVFCSSLTLARLNRAFCTMRFQCWKCDAPYTDLCPNPNWCRWNTPSAGAGCHKALCSSARNQHTSKEGPLEKVSSVQGVEWGRTGRRWGRCGVVGMLYLGGGGLWSHLQQPKISYGMPRKPPGTTASPHGDLG